MLHLYKVYLFVWYKYKCIDSYYFVASSSDVSFLNLGKTVALLLSSILVLDLRSPLESESSSPLWLWVSLSEADLEIDFLFFFNLLETCFSAEFNRFPSTALPSLFFFF